MKNIAYIILFIVLIMMIIITEGFDISINSGVLNLSNGLLISTDTSNLNFIQNGTNILSLNMGNSDLTSNTATSTTWNINNWNLYQPAAPYTSLTFKHKTTNANYVFTWNDSGCANSGQTWVSKF